MDKPTEPDKKVSGTSIIENPTPDASKPGADLSNFDFEFDYLATKKDDTPESKKDEPVKGNDNITESPKDKGASPAPASTSKSDEPTIDASIIAREAEIKGLKEELEMSKSELSQLRQVKAELEEFKKEPYVYLKKVAPIISEQLSPDRYVQSLLHKEFGADFRYDSSEAYMEGTDSYKYRLKEQELRDNLQREQFKLQQQQAEEQAQRMASMNTSKQQVMKKYHLTEEQFNSELVDWSKSKKIDYEDMAILKFLPKILQSVAEKAVAKALKEQKGNGSRTVPGAAEITGASTEGEGAHLKELSDTFGDI